MKIYLVYALDYAENGLVDMPFDVMPFLDSNAAVRYANEAIEKYVSDSNYVQTHAEDEPANFSGADIMALDHYFELGETYICQRTYNDPDSDWAYVEITISEKEV